MSQTTNPKQPVVGGLTLTWYLADQPRTVQTKAGKEMTVLELRDPRRLANSLILWLDGPATGVLEQVPPNTLVSLHVESVRSGRARGELIGQVASREVVEAAFLLAAEARGR